MLVSSGLNNDVLQYGYFTFELFYRTKTGTERKTPLTNNMYEIKEAYFRHLSLV